MTSEQHYIESRVSVECRGYSSECWIWKGRADNGHGYARIFPKMGEVLAHRLSYKTFVGNIPVGLELDHLCRVKRCCNPAHLEPVTRSENMLRLFRAAPRPLLARCRRGHDISVVGRVSQGRCRACHNIAQRRVYAERCEAGGDAA